MLRIVDGFVFEGKTSQSRWIVKSHTLGHGQTEVVAYRAVDWFEVGPLHPDSYSAQVLRGDRPDDDADDKAAANARRSARRAKSNLRKRVKAMGCTRLFTLTYQANQTDEALCKRHVEEFVRRVRRLIPGFAYVAGYEQQARGAWHVHMAIHALPRLLPAVNGVKVKSYGVLRAIWRSVIGGGGNVDDSDGRRRARGLRALSPARLAAYLSKYLSKGFEDGQRINANRWSASRIDMPAAVRVELVCSSAREMLELCWAFADGEGLEVSPWVSRFADTLFVASGPPAS